MHRPFVLINSLTLLVVGVLALVFPCLADDAPPVTGQLSLYVNGALQATTDCPSAWKATGHTIIGRGLYGGQPGDFVKGLVGDARVYDRALTAGQIKTLYAQGPQADWQFDQTQGGAANATTGWQLQGGAQFLSGQSGPLSLSGTSALADVGRTALDTSRSYTVSAWVSMSSTSSYQTLVSQDGKSVSGFFLQKRDDNKFALVVQKADDPNAGYVAAESSIVAQANVLYHVVGVFRVGPIAAAPSPAAPPAPVLTSSLPWDGNSQGKCLESLAQDRRGRTWVATEDNGVWRYDPASPDGKRWTQFTTKDGLGSDDVYALLVDSQSRVWAGTLHGVSVYDGKTWKTYGPLEGLGGSRVFALASCPTDGDVWIATEGGLTRYLTKTDRWQQYSRLDGLPSDAVQCLAFSKTGDLYAGTQCDGIAMASPLNNYKTWRTVRGPASLPLAAGGAGLPTSLINCLYVAQDGTVYAGTTAGLARSSDGGKTWRFLRGADWIEKHSGQHPRLVQDTGLIGQADLRAIEVLPRTGPPLRIAAGGTGIGEWKADQGFTGGQVGHVSSLMDSSAVENPAPQSVYQSSRYGSFTYNIPNLKPGVSCRIRLHFAEVSFDKPGLRAFNVSVNGRRVLTHEDTYADAAAQNKVIVKEFVASADARGRILLSFQGYEPLPSSDGHSLYELVEDYVTALAEDGAGHLLVGHRQKGVEMLDTQTGKRVAAKAEASPATDFVTALLPRPDGTLLIAGYGSGLSEMPIIGTTFDGVYAQTPDETDGSISLPTPASPPTVAQLHAMLTQVRSFNNVMPTGSAMYLGEDWQTRGDWVGRYGRQYARLCAMDHILTCTDAYSVEGTMGYDHNPGDGLRWWVTWMQTSDPRSLYTPVAGVRRQAEWDDHGEEYPATFAGPNIWVKVHLAEGDVHRISLYFMNKDGQGGANRLRDYLVEVKPYRKTLEAADAAPTLAHARVHDFWGGVYEQFAVRSPGDYYIKIAKNGSFNTILSGVFIDKMAGQQRVEDTEPLAYMNQVQYNPVPPAVSKSNDASIVAAITLWDALDNSYGLSNVMDKQYLYRLSSYQAVQAAGGQQSLLANWRWHLGMWTVEDRAQFTATMNRSFHAVGSLGGVELTSASNK